ncbi:hypothetical protein [Leifsonia poae]|uniref:hypothetical protein n=1 Tax=Leifsonia poae TaxID=110933 RepID=UPI001CBA7282|nr:hypothetical protein [Leifsonia poae]
MALIPEATAGPYWVSDIPAPIRVTLVDEDYEPVPLAGATISAALRVLGVHGTIPLTVTLDGDTALIGFPAGPSLGMPSVYDIELRVTTDTWSQEAEPLSFVVQAHDGWLTLYQARKQWADAKDLDDVLLWGLLDSAKRACTIFAPAIPVDDDGDVILPLPAGYTQAQLQQARNTWNATKTDPSNAGDDALFVIRPYPLDNSIKQLLRPRRGIPAVG